MGKGVKSAVSDCPSMSKGVKSAVSDCPSMGKGVKSAVSDCPSMGKGVKSAISDCCSMGKGVKSAVSDCCSMGKGVKSAVSDCPSMVCMSKGVKSAVSDCPSMSKGVKSAVSDCPSMSKGVKSAISDCPSMSKGVKSAISDCPSMSKGVKSAISDCPSMRKWGITPIERQESGDQSRSRDHSGHARRQDVEMTVVGGDPSAPERRDRGHRSSKRRKKKKKQKENNGEVNPAFSNSDAGDNRNSDDVETIQNYNRTPQTLPPITGAQHTHGGASPRQPSPRRRDAQEDVIVPIDVEPLQGKCDVVDVGGGRNFLGSLHSMLGFGGGEERQAATHLDKAARRPTMDGRMSWRGGWGRADGVEAVVIENNGREPQLISMVRTASVRRVMFAERRLKYKGLGDVVVEELMLKDIEGQLQRTFGRSFLDRLTQGWFGKGNGEPPRHVYTADPENGLYCQWMRIANACSTKNKLSRFVREHKDQGLHESSFGEIEFLGLGGYTQRSPYIRVSLNVRPEALWELMTKHWQLEPPNLLISVTGGAKKFLLKERLKNIFKIGLVKASQSTGAWIITGGMNEGVMKYVGEAIRDGVNSIAGGEQRKMYAIGIATWGTVDNRESLKGEADSGLFPAMYHAEALKHGQNMAPLDLNHTHFILVDDGTTGKFSGADITVRTRLEEYIMEQMTGEGLKDLKIPVVLLVVEGGPGTLKNTKEAVEKKIPAVIIDGSGRAADVIAYGFKRTRKKDNKPLTMEEVGKKLMSTFELEYKPNGDPPQKAYDLLDQLNYILQDPTLVMTGSTDVEASAELVMTGSTDVEASAELVMTGSTDVEASAELVRGLVEQQKLGVWNPCCSRDQLEEDRVDLLRLVGKVICTKLLLILSTFLPFMIFTIKFVDQEEDQVQGEASSPSPAVSPRKTPRFKPQRYVHSRSRCFFSLFVEKRAQRAKRLLSVSWQLGSKGIGPLQAIYNFHAFYVAFLVIFSLFILTDLHPIEEKSIGILEWLTIAWLASLLVEEGRQVRNYRCCGYLRLPGGQAGEKLQVLVLWLIPGYLAGRQIFAEHPRSLRHKLEIWFSDFWNMMDCGLLLMFLLSLVLHVTVAAEGFEVVRVMYCITLGFSFVRLPQLFMVHKDIGPKVIMIQKMLVDLVFFLVILLVFIFAYGVMRHTLIYPNSQTEWSLLLNVSLIPYWQVYGELFVDEVEGTTPSGNWLVYVLQGLYMLLTNVLLLNLLIAMFSFTFQKIQDNSEQVWRFHRYDLIYEFFDRPWGAPPVIILGHVYRFCRWVARRCAGKPLDTSDDFSLAAGKPLDTSDDFNRAFPPDEVSRQQALEKAGAENYLLRNLQLQNEHIDTKFQTTSERLEKVLDDLEDIKESVQAKEELEASYVFPPADVTDSGQRARPSSATASTSGVAVDLQHRMSNLEDQLGSIKDLLEHLQPKQAPGGAAEDRPAVARRPKSLARLAGAAAPRLGSDTPLRLQLKDPAMGHLADGAIA
uniref:TRPM SLOG domain-containing protein n=1 Tax=Branchiostoma floridae TaxID=7739 RepID=C3YF88_BRAFL|eukprot:XP_002605080.1 hypothetical protein BRAFLDRAFT_124141 [Branchiostoma floridae]